MTKYPFKARKIVDGKEKAKILQAAEEEAALEMAQNSDKVEALRKIEVVREAYRRVIRDGIEAEDSGS